MIITNTIIGYLMLSMLSTPTNVSAADTPIKNPSPIKEGLVEESTESNYSVPKVPFYSQFEDISKPYWRNKGCGIAGLAMLIDFYKPGSVSVDKLLKEGLDSGAYLTHAGWTHAGLANLAKKYGLEGAPYDWSYLSSEAAFSDLKDVLIEGPVIASVYYTFDPNSPIPHLVVITGTKDGKVYYNDPADSDGNKSISVENFKKGWKQRFITVRPDL